MRKSFHESHVWILESEVMYVNAENRDRNASSVLSRAHTVLLLSHSQPYTVPSNPTKCIPCLQQACSTMIDSGSCPATMRTSQHASTLSASPGMAVSSIHLTLLPRVSSNPLCDKDGSIPTVFIAVSSSCGYIGLTQPSNMVDPNSLRGCESMYRNSPMCGRFEIGRTSVPHPT